MKTIKIVLFSFVLFSALPAQAQTGSISGRVANGADQSLSGFLNLYTDAGQFVKQTTTDSSGNYSFTALADGSYLVQTLFAQLSNGQTYVDEIYNNVPCTAGICDFSAGTPLVISGGLGISSLNFTLDPAGSITGSISGPGGGIHSLVILYDSLGNSITNRYSAEGSGAYGFGGLPSGNYFILTANSSGLVDELYSNLQCLDSTCDITGGTPISVLAPAETSGIDLSLESGADIGGRLRTKNLPPELLARLKVTNSGITGTGSFTVKIYLSKTNEITEKSKLIKTKEIDGLLPGASKKIRVKKRSLGNKKFLIAQLDSENSQLETDETNNTLVKKVQ